MKKIVVTEYCDRCKKELPRDKTYHDMFSSDRLDIKFDRIRFSGRPFRWSKESEINTKYVTEEEKYFVLCPICSREFCEWWELGNEANNAYKKDKR